MGEHYFLLRRVRSNSWRHFRKQRSNYWKSIFFLYACSSNSFCRSIIIHCIYRSVYDVFFRVYLRVCVEFLKRKEKIEARTHTFERKPPHKRYSIFFFFIRKDLALYESIDTGDKRNKRQGRKKHKDH